MLSLSDLETADPSTDPQSIVFPFDSARASGPGDLVMLAGPAAMDLFVLALLTLVRRFGEPDFPTVRCPTPSTSAAPELCSAAWDFDYHRVVLRVVPNPDGFASFTVQFFRV
ncbi:hypothetical protein [Polyangium mundeleinium]|uniref:Archease domain-containing protein n=1 Tax=Polyangium mundeleinium TaxID=2995306 RepID=A0ABT5ERE6_9BACT|nr:hypothetical protein [Polyangium mundeleinium]MDC0744395.1 hypothetical protein [Polyangium mundeleinium]